MKLKEEKLKPFTKIQAIKYFAKIKKKSLQFEAEQKAAILNIAAILWISILIRLGPYAFYMH